MLNFLILSIIFNDRTCINIKIVSMRVLVTGGCGFIGYNFVNYLISQNLGSLEVIVLDSLVSNTSRQNSDLLP